MLSIALALAVIASADAYTKTRVAPYAILSADPIKAQCSLGKSHLHMFGGGQVDVCTKGTDDLIAEKCTSNQNKNDFSLYWVAGLRNVKTNKVLIPRVWGAYYLNIVCCIMFG